MSKKKHKPRSWDEVKKGDMFRSVKSLIPDSGAMLPKRPSGSDDTILAAVENYLRTNTGVIDPLGKRVSLVDPDYGTGDTKTVRGRAEHLLSESDPANPQKRIPGIQLDKLHTVFSVTDTIRLAQIIALKRPPSIPARIYYFRRYGEVLHMVVCDPNGRAYKMLSADIVHITQYPLNKKNKDRFENTFVLYKEKAPSFEGADPR